MRKKKIEITVPEFLKGVLIPVLGLGRQYLNLQFKENLMHKVECILLLHSRHAE